MWGATANGYITYALAATGDTDLGLKVNTMRPVVFLKSDTTLSGEGTQSNPYTIV